MVHKILLGKLAKNLGWYAKPSDCACTVQQSNNRTFKKIKIILLLQSYRAIHICTKSVEPELGFVAKGCLLWVRKSAKHFD